MDRLESISSTLSQITLYDIKSMYNQAKNVVLNISEMEAKVREATNDEAWGASSTLMQDIAQGTFNFQTFNEIMPCIYARFMEKEARQWRQIYKALQLLEYLIKNGSERVVDDARSHVSTLKMLRNFHYIDEKGKDEGLNVRNRSRELVDLLSDVDKIRGERRKAKANKHKYTGTGNDGMGLSFSSGGGSGRFSGFGNESMGGSGSYGSYGGGSGSYGGNGGSYDREWGGGGLGGGSSGFRDDTRRGGFDEYNAGDDEIATPHRSNSVSNHTRSNTVSSTSAESRQTTPAVTAPPPAKEVDLLGGFLDDDFSGGGSTAAAEKALPALSPPAPASIDDDEFADFQAAPIVPAAQPNPVASKPDLMDMLNSNTATRPAVSFNQVAHQSQPTVYGNNNNNFGTTSGNRMTYTPNSLPAQQMFGGGAPMIPMSPPMKPTSPPLISSPLVPSANPPKASANSLKPSANFDDLWSMSLAGSGNGNTPSKPFGASGSTSGSKSIKDLEKEKAMAGLWGSTGGAGGAQGMGSFGAFGGMSTGHGGASMGSAAPLSSSSASATAVDDLLL